MKKLSLLFSLLLTSFLAIGNGGLSELELRAKAEAFIEAKNARQQPQTTKKDIEHFLSLLADEFVDEHVKFNVTVTSKDELRKGMTLKLQDKVHYSNVKIDQMMVGSNVVFVKYTESAKVEPSHMDKAVEYSSTNIVSLEFDSKGLIKHIRRHHGL